jgi:hypothetical protein
MAMFAERVLLVEGSSDETIVTQLARRMELPLLARNAQVLPVTGKGEFIEVAKLFRLMNKQVCVLADLDALADENNLINFFSNLSGASEVAASKGAKSIVALDGDLRGDFSKFIMENRHAVDRAASGYPNWSTSTELEKHRITLSQLIIGPEKFEGESAAAAKGLSRRYAALLETLSLVGCFFLRAGNIENYYVNTSSAAAKPIDAAREAATFSEMDPNILQERYADVLKAIRYLAPDRSVEENRVLRPKLAAAISAVFQMMTPKSANSELDAFAQNTIGASAAVFKFENVSKNDELRLRVLIASRLFHSDQFPIEIARGDNINQRLPAVLPG